MPLLPHRSPILLVLLFVAGLWLTPIVSWAQLPPLGNPPTGPTPTAPPTAVPPPGTPPPAGPVRPPVTRPHRPPAIDLTGTWYQNVLHYKVFYRLTRRPGQWPMPHDYECHYLDSRPRMRLPFKPGTMTLVFKYPTGDTIADGKILHFFPTGILGWVDCQVSIVGPNQLSIAVQGTGAESSVTVYRQR